MCLPMCVRNMILTDSEVFLVALSLQQSFAEPKHIENAKKKKNPKKTKLPPPKKRKQQQQKTKTQPSLCLLTAAFCWKQAVSWAMRFKYKDGP